METSTCGVDWWKRRRGTAVAVSLGSASASKPPFPRFLPVWTSISMRIQSYCASNLTIQKRPSRTCNRSKQNTFIWDVTRCAVYSTCRNSGTLLLDFLFIQPCHMYKIEELDTDRLTSTMICCPLLSSFLPFTMSIDASYSPYQCLMLLPRLERLWPPGTLDTTRTQLASGQKKIYGQLEYGVPVRELHNFMPDSSSGSRRTINDTQTGDEASLSGAEKDWKLWEA